MEIKTKFDIHQAVYFMENNKINKGRIANLKASVYSGNVISIEYTVSKEVGTPNSNVKEETLFATREDLFNSL